MGQIIQGACVPLRIMTSCISIVFKNMWNIQKNTKLYLKNVFRKINVKSVFHMHSGCASYTAHPDKFLKIVCYFIKFNLF